MGGLLGTGELKRYTFNYKHNHVPPFFWCLFFLGGFTIIWMCLYDLFASLIRQHKFVLCFLELSVLVLREEVQLGKQSDGYTVLL